MMRIIITLMLMLWVIIFVFSSPVFSQTQNTLILVIDVSTSINDEEMNLQMEGYRSVLEYFPYLENQYMEVILFSTSSSVVAEGSLLEAQEFFENWSIPTSVTSATPYHLSGLTCVESALQLISSRYHLYPGIVTIDISSDGIPNCSLDASTISLVSSLTELGAVINVLVINSGNLEDYLEARDFYTAYVSNNLVFETASFLDLEYSLYQKISIETSFMLD